MEKAEKDFYFTIEQEKKKLESKEAKLAQEDTAEKEDPRKVSSVKPSFQLHPNR